MTGATHETDGAQSGRSRTPGGPPRYSVVVPTIGRPSLAVCLRALAAATDGPDIGAPEEILVVDDRPDPAEPLRLDATGLAPGRTRVLRGGGHGPAAARNVGLAAVTSPWTVFLDDDVRPRPGWGRLLAEDLAAAEPDTVGVQGRIRVPLPADRPPTDWERGTAGLENAAWATADMAYRTGPLRRAGGFDERFRRAFREDADLALRLLGDNWTLRRGARLTDHPVRPADRWVSVRAQRGNADDALMTRLHGTDWWDRAQAPRGRLPRHALVSGCAVAALGAALAGRPRLAGAAAALWALGTAEFTLVRVAPGPRTLDETGSMALTSAVIPPLAVAHWLRGVVRHRHAAPLEHVR